MVLVLEFLDRFSCFIEYEYENEYDTVGTAKPIGYLPAELVVYEN